MRKKGHFPQNIILKWERVTEQDEPFLVACETKEEAALPAPGSVAVGLYRLIKVATVVTACRVDER